MKKFILVALGLLFLLSTGAVAGYKYREYSSEEKLNLVKAEALKSAVRALYLSEQAGIYEERIRCAQIYDRSISGTDDELQPFQGQMLPQGEVVK